MNRRAKTRVQKNENDAFNLIQGKYLRGASKLVSFAERFIILLLNLIANRQRTE